MKIQHCQVEGLTVKLINQQKLPKKSVFFAKCLHLPAHSIPLQYNNHYLTSQEIGMHGNANYVAECLEACCSSRAPLWEGNEPIDSSARESVHQQSPPECGTRRRCRRDPDRHRRKVRAFIKHASMPGPTQAEWNRRPATYSCLLVATLLRQPKEGPLPR